MLKPLEYLLQRGIDVVIKECDGSLKFVKEHITRKCNLPKNFHWQYTLTKIKKYLKSKNQNVKDVDVEILETIKEAINND